MYNGIVTSSSVVVGKCTADRQRVTQGDRALPGRLTALARGAWPQSEIASSLGITFTPKHYLAVYHRQHRFQRQHLLRTRRENRAVEYHQVGKLSDLYAALAVLLEAGVGSVASEGTDGIQHRNLLGSSHRRTRFSLAGHSAVDASKRIRDGDGRIRTGCGYDSPSRVLGHREHVLDAF